MVPGLSPILSQKKHKTQRQDCQKYQRKEVVDGRIKRVERDEVARGYARPRELEADSRRVALLQIPPDRAAHPDEAVLHARRKQASVRGVGADVNRELTDSTDGVDRFDTARGKLVCHIVKARLGAGGQDGGG